MTKMATNYSPMFEEFWRKYPKVRKTGKAAAYKVWERDKLDVEVDVICKSLDGREDNDPQWKKGFVPMPSTFLNQERWKDEWESDKQKAKQKFQQQQSSWQERHDPGADLPPFVSQFNRVLFGYIGRKAAKGILIPEPTLAKLVKIKNDQAKVWCEECELPDHMDSSEFLAITNKMFDAAVQEII